MAARPKADPVKANGTLPLGRQTPMTRPWIAHRLHLGSASYVSHLAAKGNDCRL